ncbi:MAG: hypothetical protein QW430_12400 [Metallosphaera sp.]|uniref:hypothetical protein n=1 Tax=Metallosphaera sp. TaxID=2020860 RepID=UPI003167F248
MSDPINQMIEYLEQEIRGIQERRKQEEKEERKRIRQERQEEIKEKITKLYNIIVKEDLLGVNLNKLYNVIDNYAKEIGSEAASKAFMNLIAAMETARENMQKTLKEMYEIVNHKKKNSKNKLLVLTINLFKQYGIIRALYDSLDRFSKIRKSEVYNDTGDKSLRTLLHITLNSSLKFLLELLIES